MLHIVSYHQSLSNRKLTSSRDCLDSANYTIRLVISVSTSSLFVLADPSLHLAQNIDKK